MTIRAALWLAVSATALSAASCGSGASQPAATDAAIDSSTSPDSAVADGPTGDCHTTTKFGTPRALGELAASDQNSFPRLTADELTIVFYRQDGAGPRIATRASRAEKFGNVVPFEAGVGGTVSLSHDGLVAYGAPFAADGVKIATRASSTAPFGPPAPVPGLEDVHHPFLTITGTELWVVRQLPGASPAILRASVTSGVVGTPEPATTFGAGDYGVAPTLSRDGLTLYFGSPLGVPGDYDIFVAHRASTSDLFASPTAVTELNSSARELPGWLSPDDCRLYFQQGHAIAVAERSP